MPPPSTTKILKKPTETEELHLNNTDDEPDCCCVHVNEHVVALRTLLDGHIINLKKIIPSQAAEPITAFDTIPQNAFVNHKKLMQYEENLKNSSEARKQLETLYYIGGGDCLNEMIKRGLIRIFSNKLARKCSWYGRKENYPLNQLVVISTLRDAARKRFSSMTDSDFERLSSTWFRQAALRFKRENDK